MAPTDSLERSNILWICTDQQRWDTIGALGNTVIHTPNLDRLAARGVSFGNAYCQAPACTPSRASFLTGQYPSSIHACQNGNDRYSGAGVLAGRYFADYGYHCALVGKLHIAAADGRIPPRADNGYHEFIWSHSPRDRWGDDNEYIRWLRNQGVAPQELLSGAAPIPAAYHHITWLTEQARSFVMANRRRPWMLSVNSFDPHPRYTDFSCALEYQDRYRATELPEPAFTERDIAMQRALSAIDFQTDSRTPEEHGVREKAAGYYGSIEHLDTAVGEIVDALESSGQLDRTVIVFMSDHGEMLGDHGLLLKGCRFYEGLVKVPLIIAGPGVEARGKVSSALVELVDVLPTLLRLAGIEARTPMAGRSLLPVLTDEGDVAHRDTVRCEYYGAIGSDTTARVRMHGSYGTMIRDQRYKLCVYHGHDVGELYDLQRDPHEHVNLWADPAMSQIRYDLLKRSFDSLALSVDVGPPRVGYY